MRKLSFMILIFLCLDSNATAWDDLGHMTAGAIAYDRLTPEVRQKVIALLKLNPQYAMWVADVPEDDRPRVAFLRASRWADDIKRDPAYEQDGGEGGNRPSGQNAARNIGYADKLMHKYWHSLICHFHRTISHLPTHRLQMQRRRSPCSGRR